MTADYQAALDAEVQAAHDQAAAAVQAGDRDKVMAALYRFDAIFKAVTEARENSTDMTRDLIARALRLGVDRRELHGRPYSSPIVREIARNQGLPDPKPGRRPRPRTGGTSWPAAPLVA